MKEAILILVDQDTTDEGHKYPVSKVYRFDYECEDETLVTAISNHTLEESQLKS